MSSAGPKQCAAYPLFIKPANLGSSVGITKCNNRADLGEGLLEAAAYDRRVLVERGVNAREIEVSVLGNDDAAGFRPRRSAAQPRVLLLRIQVCGWHLRSAHPGPPARRGYARRSARWPFSAYKAIDCAGMARVDFFLEKTTGEIYLNELNTIPGFTSISMYPKLWEATGLSYAKLVDRLVELALERKADRNRTERRFRRIHDHSAKNFPRQFRPPAPHVSNPSNTRPAKRCDTSYNEGFAANNTNCRGRFLDNPSDGIHARRPPTPDCLPDL